MPESPRRPHPGGLATHRSRRRRSTKIRQASIDAHLPLIEEAGKTGVQILCLQEIFNGPYFCPSQDAHWYDAAEPVPGPDDRADGRVRARSTRWRWSCRSTSASRPASTTTPPRCIDADGSYLGKYRKNHIPQTIGFWEKYFFKPGNLGYPVFQTRYAKIGVYICYDRHFPEGARAARPERRRDRLQPVGHGRRALAVSVEARAAGARGGQRLLHGAASTASAPRRRGTSASSTARRYFVDPRGNFLAAGSRGQGRARRRRDGPRPDRGGAPHLAVLSATAAPTRTATWSERCCHDAR